MKNIWLPTKKISVNCQWGRGSPVEKFCSKLNVKNRAGKHEHGPGNTNASRQMGSGLKFLVDYQLKWIRHRTGNTKNSGSIFLYMRVKIPGALGINHT
jgi:hypothetical protein